jgi:hypothetical protein
VLDSRRLFAREQLRPLPKAVPAIQRILATVLEYISDPIS